MTIQWCPACGGITAYNGGCGSPHTPGRLCDCYHKATAGDGGEASKDLRKVLGLDALAPDHERMTAAVVEINRLRESLRMIAEMPNDHLHDVGDCNGIARAALEGPA